MSRATNNTPNGSKGVSGLKTLGSRRASVYSHHFLNHFSFYVKLENAKVLAMNNM